MCVCVKINKFVYSGKNGNINKSPVVTSSFRVTYQTEVARRTRGVVVVVESAVAFILIYVCLSVTYF